MCKRPHPIFFFLFSRVLLRILLSNCLILPVIIAMFAILIAIIATAVATSAVPTPSNAVPQASVRLDQTYDNPKSNLNGVACSTGENGLVTKGQSFSPALIAMAAYAKLQASLPSIVCLHSRTSVAPSPCPSTLRTVGRVGSSLTPALARALTSLRSTLLDGTHLISAVRRWTSSPMAARSSSAVSPSPMSRSTSGSALTTEVCPFRVLRVSRIRPDQRFDAIGTQMCKLKV